MVFNPPFPPVRPMDPMYLKEFMSKKKMNKTFIDGIVKALNAYNSECNAAANKLEKALNKLI